MPIVRQAPHENHVGLLLERGEGNVEGDIPTPQDVPVPSHLVLEVQDVAALRPFFAVSFEIGHREKVRAVSVSCSSRMFWGGGIIVNLEKRPCEIPTPSQDFGMGEG